MITLRYQHLFHKNFVLCCQALKKTRFRDYKSPRNALKILQEIDENVGTSRDLYQKTFDPYFAKDADGNRIEEKSEISQFKIVEGKEEEYKKAFVDFLNTEFTINCEKVNPDMILEAKFSPMMVGILADIFDDEF